MSTYLWLIGQFKDLNNNCCQLGEHFKRIHIGFFRFSTKPFIRIKTYCLCIGFEKLLRFTCSMSTLESTSCQPVKKPKHLEQSDLQSSFYCCYRVLYQILPLHWSTLELLGKWTTPLLIFCYCIFNNMIKMWSHFPTTLQLNVPF